MADQPDIVKAMTEGMAQLLDGTGVILDAIEGYRTECLRRGFSETAAEAMSMDLHSATIRLILRVTT